MAKNKQNAEKASAFDKLGKAITDSFSGVALAKIALEIVVIIALAAILKLARK